MYTKEQLLELNSEMLHRGAPDVDDGVGYNKPDYHVGGNLGGLLTDAQAYILASTLLKYCKTQGIADAEYMMDTMRHYQSIVPMEEIQRIRGMAIGLEVSKDLSKVAFTFRYDEDLINLMKRHSGRFMKAADRKYWVLPTHQALAALRVLKEWKYDVDLFISAVEKAMEDPLFGKDRSDASSHKLTLHVVASDDESIQLKFDYDAHVVAAIKEIPYKSRVWNNDSKTWMVSRYAIGDLMSSLKALEVDYSEITDYAVSQNTIVNIDKRIVHIDNLSVHIKCVNTSLSEVFERLRFKYLENSAEEIYSIPRTQLPTLIGFMKQKGIETDYQVLEDLVKFKKPPVRLMNTSTMVPCPRDYQILGAKFLLRERKAILADKMGLGKSKTLVMACESIRGAKKLFVCPATIKIKLMQEIKVVNPEARVYIVSATRKWKQNLADEADYIIMNYALLSKHREDIDKMHFDVLAVDEAHKIGAIDNYGETSSIRAKEILRLGSKVEYFFQLTGTPVRNHMKSYFNLLRGAESEVAFSWRYFAFRYTDAEKNPYGWVFNGSRNEVELHEVTSRKVLRRINPTNKKVIKQFIPLEMSRTVKKNYEKLLEEYADDMSDNPLAFFGACKHYLAQAKVPQTIDFISDILEQNMTIVVFTAYNKVIDDIVDKFDNPKSSVHGKVRVIRGGTPEKLREKYRDELNEGEARLLVGNIQAMGEGIDLDKVDVGVANDLTWVYTELEQAEYRLERMTRTEHGNFYYMYCEDIDFDVYLKNMIESKWRSSEKVLTGDASQKEFFDTMMSSIREKNLTKE